jgi:O-antigen/teichoic acid export membrane protein
MSLRAGFAWMLGGNLVFAASQWMLLIVLAKYIGVEAVGQFALGLAVAAPIFAFASLRLRAVQATDVDTDFVYGTYFGFTLLASLVALLMVAASVAIASWNETGLIILIVAFVKALEMLSDISQGLMQRHERNRAIACSQFAKGVSGVILVAAGAIYFESVTAAAFGLVAARLLLLAAYDIPVTRWISAADGMQADAAPRFVSHELHRLLMQAYPVGIVIAMNALQLSIPRFAINLYDDEAAVGYYSAIAYIAVALGMVINALAQAALPRLAQYYRSNRSAYLLLLAKLTGGTLIVATAAAVACLLYGREILSFFYTNDFANHGELFLWVIIGAGFQYINAIIGAALTAARAFRSQAVVSFLVTLVIVVACFILTKNHGLIGAAAGIVIGNVFKMALQILQIVRVCRAD